MKGDIVVNGHRFPGHYKWWQWPVHMFRNRCPYCKCLDLGEYVNGVVECGACHKRWRWDDDDR